jgi:hypothetical protein
MTTRRARRAHGVLALTSILLAACTSHPPTPPAAAEPSSPAPTATTAAPSRIDQGDATAVSRAAVQTMWTVDAALDHGQRDAYLRAQPYLTPDYATRLQNEPEGTLPGLWRDHHAYAKLHLTAQPPESGAGPDTPTTAHRQWQITVNPTGRDGWKAPPIRAIAFVTLTRASGRAPWKVSTVGTA